MKRHVTSTGAVGMAVALLALLATAAPAAANTTNIEDNSGFIDLYELFNGTPLLTLDITEAGRDCAEPDGEITLSGGPGNGPLAGDLETSRTMEIPDGSGDWFKFMATWTFSGTWVAPSSVSGTIDPLLFRLWPVDGAQDCTTTGDPCIVTSFAVIFTGTVSHAAPLPTLTSGDTITIDGANNDFETVVAGDTMACGVMVAVDNGRIALRSYVFTVL